jgi:hypothetical protein
MKKKKSKWLLWLRILLDVLIGIGIFANLLFHRRGRKRIVVGSEIRNIHRIKSDLRVPPPGPKLDFTEKELREAIVFLKLPTWSRSWIPCDSPKSELTCSQVIRAYRTIKSWHYNITSTKLEDRRWVKAFHYIDGVGNRLSKDSLLLFLSILGNRSFIVEGRHLAHGQETSVKANAYEYDPAILLWTEELQEIIDKSTQKNIYFVKIWEDWFDQEFWPNLNSARLIRLQELIYAIALYGHADLSPFAQEYFGIHTLYFMLNYMIYIPEDILNFVAKIMNTVPRSVYVMGVHLRFQFPGQFYSYSIGQSLSVAVPFLRYRMERKPTVFAFASDSTDMENAFRAVFSNVIVTNVVRRPDWDHASALIDVIFLQMCNGCLLSYRSTFSNTIAYRMGKRCYWIEKESPEVFQLSNSQAGAVSMVFHFWDPVHWLTSRAMPINSNSEKYFRFFWKYLVF